MFTYIFTILKAIFFVAKEVLTTPSALPYEIMFVICIFLMILLFRKSTKTPWWKWALMLFAELCALIPACIQAAKLSLLDMNWKEIGDWFVCVCAMVVFGILFFVTLMHCTLTDREK